MSTRSNTQIDSKLVSRKETFWTLCALLCLTALLLFPFAVLLCDTALAQRFENSLARYLGPTSIYSNAVAHTVVATTSSMVPLLIDNSLDVLNVFDASNLERFYFVLVFVLTKLVNYLACTPGNFSYPLSMYFLSISTQFTCAFAIAFLALHRLQPKFFGSGLCVAVIASCFALTYFGKAHVVYGAEWLLKVSLFCRAVVGILVVPALSASLYRGVVSYRASKLPLKAWIKSLDTRHQHALLIASTLLATVLVMIISAHRFHPDAATVGSFHHFAQSFLINFHIGSACFAVLFVVIPHRHQKSLSLQLQHSLDMKKQFVR